MFVHRECVFEELMLDIVLYEGFDWKKLDFILDGGVSDVGC